MNYWNVTEVIQMLCIDKAFGIFTRNGLDYQLHWLSKPSEYIISLLDFQNVSNMNKELGYIEVNNRFKQIFEPFKNKMFIGRCFSGDEILILYKKTEEPLFREFASYSYENNLFFYMTGMEYSGNLDNDILTLIENLKTKSMIYVPPMKKEDFVLIP